jgi:hypothetical protein
MSIEILNEGTGPRDKGRDPAALERTEEFVELVGGVEIGFEFARV